MNRLVIPSILTATVLVAGIFALMPVDKASTVHTTIQAVLQGSTRDTLVVQGFDLGADEAIVLVDNAGAGGEFDAEVVWKLPAACLVRELDDGTVTTIANDNALDAATGDAALAHGDITGADAVFVEDDGTGNCDTSVNHQQFISVTIIRSTDTG